MGGYFHVAWLSLWVMISSRLCVCVCCDHTECMCVHGCFMVAKSWLKWYPQLLSWILQTQLISIWGADLHWLHFWHFISTSWLFSTTGDVLRFSYCWCLTAAMVLQGALIWTPWAETHRSFHFSSLARHVQIEIDFFQFHNFSVPLAVFRRLRFHHLQHQYEQRSCLFAFLL